MTPRLRLSDPLLRVQSDERLAALAGHGGDRAFAILVERHRGALLAFARRLGAGAGAEDVVQQALLHAWSALGRGTRVAHVRAWLHQIVRHAAIRAAAGTLDSAELPTTLAAVGQTADEAELRHEARRLLDEIERLPARQREALLRVAVVGSSGEEAGNAMGLEANAVRQLAHRARTRLRMAMGACVPWPLALWAARDGAAPLLGAPPELLGGAGLAGGASAGAGLLKLGAIATTGVVVAIGAGGVVSHHAHRAAAARTHVAAARERVGAAPTASVPSAARQAPGDGGSGAGHAGRHGSSDSSGDGRDGGAGSGADGRKGGSTAHDQGGAGTGEGESRRGRDGGGTGSPPRGTDGAQEGSGSAPSGDPSRTGDGAGGTRQPDGSGTSGGDDAGSGGGSSGSGETGSGRDAGSDGSGSSGTGSADSGSGASTTPRATAGDG